MKESGARRDQVLRAAVDVIAERGPHGLTYRSADERAGVPRGTASNYFRSWDQLLTGSLRYVQDAMFASLYKMDNAVIEGEADLATRMATVVQRSLVDARRLVLIWSRIATEGFGEAAVRETVVRYIEAAIDRLEPALVVCGSTRPREDAELILGCMYGLTLVQYATGWPARVDDRVIRPLVRGLLRSDRPRTRRRRPVDPLELTVPGQGGARRVQVAEAATRVLVSKGFRGLTHRSVDRHAGLPAGTTSNHFRTYQALVDAVQERAIGSFAISAYETLRALPRNVAALRRLLERILAAALADDAFQGMALVVFVLEAANNPSVAEGVTGLLDMWGMGFARWFDDVGTSDPVLHGHLVQSFMVGMVLMHHLHPQGGLDQAAGVEPLVWGLLNE